MKMITKEMLRALRFDIDAALVAVAEKHGLKSLTTGSATFGPGHFTMKLDGLAEGGKSREAARYESAGFLGLPPLGSTFRSGGHTYTTVGLNTTGSKVLCDREDGKTYLYPVDTCKALVAVQNPTQSKGKK